MKRERSFPVTVVEAGPCVVMQKKTVENDGYDAVQIGFGDQKPQQGQQAPGKATSRRADVAPKKTLREFRLDDISALNVGDIDQGRRLRRSATRVDVTGTSKGKGYAGVIKRWNFHRLKETHGTGPVARHAGSNGACSDPVPRVQGQEAWPAIMGAETVTVQNLDRRQGGRRKQPDCGQGRHPRPQGRHRRDPRQRESVREGGIQAMPKVSQF